MQWRTRVFEYVTSATVPRKGYQVDQYALSLTGRSTPEEPCQRFLYQPPAMGFSGRRADFSGYHPLRGRYVGATDFVKLDYGVAKL